MSEEAEDFLTALGRLGGPVLSVMEGFEQIQRRLHPPNLPALRAALEPHVEQLSVARTRFSRVSPPEGLEGLGERLDAAAGSAEEAGRLFVEEAPPEAGVARVLGAMRAHARAQAELFPLADVLPPVHRYFTEPSVLDARPRPESPGDNGRQVGVFSAGNGPDQRGGFTLYVPPECDGQRPMPLVVALHGGMGHGAEFLWTWLREARSRGFMLLAPTSKGSTWSLGPVDVDGPNLRSMFEYVSGRWPVDPARVLLTGLSDGATYTLLHGLSESVPYTALAPISGVLHPLNFANGNLSRVRDRRIYLVHGSLDWMFPVQIARDAAAELREAGADLVFREIEDLSHAYPREENPCILEWFDPGLGLGEQSSTPA